MMPGKANNWHDTAPADGFSWQSVALPNGKTGMRVYSGSYGKKINDAFHLCVKTLLNAGHNLIIDDVADGSREVNIWLDELKNDSVFTVGLACSITSLEQREIARGYRTLGSSVEQYYRVHHGVKYDLMIDTDKLSTQEAAKKIVEVLQKY
ncbi:hypothetical protein A8L45_13825 [Veronia pacifica]|uniref:Chloramphenicol phosphotransferase n=2 Tax=Veronia pacifica TaxID=1080227 RepID=A0A1C3EGB0_9GAMM|nr:hypothetical protein A8L45_13825 [Veronia pacifica]